MAHGTPAVAKLSIVTVANRARWGARTYIIPARASLVAIVFCSACHGWRSHPTDNEMTKVFNENESRFVQLQAMFLAEPQMVDGIWPEEKRPSVVSEDRWHAYLVLLDQLGVENGITRRSEQCAMWLNVSGGWWLDPSYKGYAYCTVRPAKIYESLDRPRGLESGVVAYRPIRSNWYIYYWWDG